METKRLAPAPANPKRIRIRKCHGVLRVPVPLLATDDGAGAEAVFTCQQNVHGPEIPHQEKGIVHMPNGTAREYEITWRDLGLIAARRRIREVG